MKAILLIIFTSLFMMGCDRATFSDGGGGLESLADGETVEVVDDETLDALADEDTGVGDGTSGDIATGDDDDDDEDGGDRHTASDDDDDDDHHGDDAKRDGHKKKHKDKGKKKGCKERLMRHLKEGNHRHLVTTPDEMENDKDMNEAVKCGKNGKKVLVCHHPSSDEAKKKTLCVGAPALKAFIEHMPASAVNYAGACKEDQSESED